MIGLRFDFEENDLMLNAQGSFVTTTIDSQNCAFIAVSQICRLTAPHVGEQLASKLQNRRPNTVSAAISAAVRAVENDGGSKVSITINEYGQLQFVATYAND